MQGWGGSCREVWGGLCRGGVSGSCRGRSALCRGRGVWVM